jgi:excinuclease ABC subunit A
VPGQRLVAVEMHFLPTVYVTCDVCNGKRFMKETLEVKYKKKNIHDVLSMTVEEANKFFEDIPAISDRLQTLIDVGLAISSSARARRRSPAGKRSG